MTNIFRISHEIESWKKFCIAICKFTKSTDQKKKKEKIARFPLFLMRPLIIISENYTKEGRYYVIS